jgi:hypothetical protein
MLVLFTNVFMYALVALQVMKLDAEGRPRNLATDSVIRGPGRKNYDNAFRVAEDLA